LIFFYWPKYHQKGSEKWEEVFKFQPPARTKGRLARRVWGVNRLLVGLCPVKVCQVLLYRKVGSRTRILGDIIAGREKLDLKNLNKKYNVKLSLVRRCGFLRVLQGGLGGGFSLLDASRETGQAFQIGRGRIICGGERKRKLMTANDYEEKGRLNNGFFLLTNAARRGCSSSLSA